MSELRIAIYGRQGNDAQHPKSDVDRAAGCETLVERLGGTVVGIYADAGACRLRDRPGLTSLLRHVDDGRVDVVACEALDRIGRDGEDVRRLLRELRSHGVRLVTGLEGEIDEMHFALIGLPDTTTPRNSPRTK